VRLSAPEHLTACGLLDRGVHADARPVVAAGGQRRQIKVGSGPVQGAEHVFPGAGQVVDRAGFDIGDPQRENRSAPTAPGYCRRARGPCRGLAGVPQIDLLALTLVVFSLQRSAEKIFPSRIM
jgi:hypothetical protein